MKTKIQSLEFSGTLLDFLFALVIFSNLEAIFRIQTIEQMVFYVFSFIIVTYWWINFKSSNYILAEKNINSVLTHLFGLFYIIALEFSLIFIRTSSFQNAIYLLTFIFVIDFFWFMIWRHVGKWNVRGKKKIKTLEEKLDKKINLNFLSIALFILIIASTFLLETILIIGLTIISFLIIIFFTFYFEIIEFKVFLKK